MLDAEIEKLLKPILELYSQIETDLLLNIAKRFDTYETIGGSLDWYLQRLQGMGAFTKSNLKIIEQYSPATKKLIRKLLEQVGYYTMLTNGTMNLETLMASTVNRRIIESIISDLEHDINIIDTKALENTNKAYMDILTKGYIETAGGVYSYQESIKRALLAMSEQGIGGASYLRKGKVVRYSLEGTVRRDILTRAHKCSVEVQMNNIKELGSNLVYVSQHMGARVHPTDKWANHAGWQGKVYMLEGSSDKYENLVEATGYGDITGLAGVNCRHHIYNYIEGVTKLPNRLDEAENERVYKLSQEQRKMERDVRKAKKELAVAKQMGDTDTTKYYQKRLKGKTERLDSFVREHPELKRDYTRTKVSEEYIVRDKTLVKKLGISQEYWDKFMTEDERDFCRKFPKPIQWIDRNITDEHGKVIPSYDFRMIDEGLLYELKTPVKKPKYSNIARTISGTVAKSKKNRFMINLKSRRLTKKLENELSFYNIRHPRTKVKNISVFSEGKIIKIEFKK